MSQDQSFPFGFRDGKLYEITDVSTPTYASAVDFPAAQNFEFTPEDTTAELEGDDETVAVHSFTGRGTWTLGKGGITLTAWEVLTGGTVTSSDSSPNEVSMLQVKSTDTRPYFGFIGQAISAAEGDVHIQIMKAKCNDGPSGAFSGGEFYVTAASGVAIPDASDVLYNVLVHESQVTIPSTFPTAIYNS